MPSEQLSLTEIAVISTAVGVNSAVNSSFGALIHGSSVGNSAVISGLGTVGVCLGFGFFARNDITRERVSNLEQMYTDLAVFNIVMYGYGALMGQMSAMLFFGMAASTDPIIDTLIGLPISLGIFICCCLLLSEDTIHNNLFNDIEAAYQATI